jgi:phosphoribosylformimino-5-aminoimidazole carboxamide ribotide isomerase
MIVIGSMDFYKGQVVRLTQGELDSVHQVKEDALQWLSTLQNHGLQRLHCVDLDGAFKSGDNIKIISEIISNSKCPVQVGGGIHSIEAVDLWFSLGAESVVLGSGVFTSEGLLEASLDKYKDKIIVALDVKDEKVMIHGWTKQIDEDLQSLLKRFEGLGVKTILMSDVSKDGMMQGSNVSLYQKVSQWTTMDIQASGGIKTRQDVLDLVPYNLMGVIVGKALIHQTLDLDILGETL